MASVATPLTGVFSKPAPLSGELSGECGGREEKNGYVYGQEQRQDPDSQPGREEKGICYVHCMLAQHPQGTQP